MLINTKKYVKLLLEIITDTKERNSRVNNMGTCLGIYLGDKILKYAKLTKDEKSSKVSLISYGTKYVAGEKNDLVREIIAETGSSETKLSINAVNSYKMQSEVLRQLSRADIQSVINLEAEDFAVNNGLSERLLEHREIFMDSRISNDNYTADITLVDKINLQKYTNDSMYINLASVYPIDYVLPNLVQNSSNYLIINIDEKTELIGVTASKINSICDIDINMSNILGAIAELEGSYEKACDICKNINVLSDDNISKEIEKIIEPTIQDLLNRIKTKIDESKIRYERIYINGLINLFINIEVLFEQFFGITTEKLRPTFINNEELTANLSEVIESNEAIALAYTELAQNKKDVNFLETVKAEKFSFASLLKKDKNDKKMAGLDNNKSRVMPSLNINKTENILAFASATAGAVFLGYAGFSILYNSELSKMERNLKSDIANIQKQTELVTDDLNYVKDNKNKYTEFNSFISDTVQKIREGKIGKYTTYNVANFMQKIARFIPSNVQLESVSSNDNKSVKIVAKSGSYAELGYFISQLKLQGVLENIKTGDVKIQDSTTTTVEDKETKEKETKVLNFITVTIGGDLP